ncbi:MAG: hypothetical protein EON94_09210, partial [Caulobacteraceae bacterium]
STAASHALASEAVELARLIGQFKTGAAEPAQRPAERQRPGQRQAVGGSGPRLVAERQDSGWEEF